MSAASLKVTTEARPSSRLAVTVTVPAERSKASYEDAIKSLSNPIHASLQDFTLAQKVYRDGLTLDLLELAFAFALLLYLR